MTRILFKLESDNSLTLIESLFYYFSDVNLGNGYLMLIYSSSDFNLILMEFVSELLPNINYSGVKIKMLEKNDKKYK